MKKSFLKLIISLVLVIAVLLPAFSITSYADDDNTLLAFSSDTVTVGDTVDVTVTVTGTAITVVHIDTLTYDSEILEFISGDFASGGAGSLRIFATFNDPASSKRFKIKFRALKSGVAPIRVSSGIIADGVSPNVHDVLLTGAYAELKVMDPALSGNANLSALTVSSGTLSPKFSASKTSYSVNVPNSVTRFTVYATAADSGANVNVPATTNLKIGKNTINVLVTAPNGTQKTYTITVTRSEEEVSEPETSEPEVSTPDEDSQILINGTEYISATDISGITLPVGFSASTATYKGTEVPVAEDADKKYIIYYLAPKDSSDFAPYTYDEDKDEFKSVIILNRNDRMYIVEDIPDSDDIPDEYYITNTTIDSLAIKCLRRNGKGFEDFCYIYCYIDGKSQFYKYDTTEESLQRYPEFSLGIPDSKPAANTDKDSFKDRFASLSGNQKIVAVAFGIIVLLVVVLIVLLIKRIFTNKDSDDDFLDYQEDDEETNEDTVDEIDDSDDEFDEVKISNTSDEEDDF